MNDMIKFPDRYSSASIKKSNASLSSSASHGNGVIGPIQSSMNIVWIAIRDRVENRKRTACCTACLRNVSKTCRYKSLNTQLSILLVMA